MPTTDPRLPTDDELAIIATITQPETDPSVHDVDEHYMNVSNQRITVFDRYISDGPGYTGRVAVVVWGGGPEIISVICLDGDNGAYLYEDELPLRKTLVLSAPGELRVG